MVRQKPSDLFKRFIPSSKTPYTQSDYERDQKRNKSMVKPMQPIPGQPNAYKPGWYPYNDRYQDVGAGSIAGINKQSPASNVGKKINIEDLKKKLLPRSFR